MLTISIPPFFTDSCARCWPRRGGASGAAMRSFAPPPRKALRRRGGAPPEQVAKLFGEGAPLRLHLFAELARELLQQLTLPLGELSGHLERDLDALVAAPEPRAPRDPLPLDAQHAARLRPRRHPELPLSVE